MRRKHDRGTWYMTDDDVAEAFVQTFAQEEREQAKYAELALRPMSTASLMCQCSKVGAFYRWMNEQIRARWKKDVRGQYQLWRDIP